MWNSNTGILHLNWLSSFFAFWKWLDGNCLATSLLPMFWIITDNFQYIVILYNGINVYFLHLHHLLQLPIVYLFVWFYHCCYCCLTAFCFQGFMWSSSFVIIWYAHPIIHSSFSVHLSHITFPLIIKYGIISWSWLIYCHSFIFRDCAIMVWFQLIYTYMYASLMPYQMVTLCY